MRYLRLIGRYLAASVKEQLAHRANSWISVLHSLLNLLSCRFAGCQFVAGFSKLLFERFDLLPHPSC